MSSRPTRVLWLAKGLGRGGAEKLLVTGAAHVDRERFEVEVAYLLPWKDALVPELSSRGLRVHCLGQNRATDVHWVARLRRLVRLGRFDLVHTHMPIPAVAARLVLGRGPALVHTEHNVWQRYRRPTYWANAATYRRNDAVIAVSQAVAQSMRAGFLPRFPATTEVLLHGVEHSLQRSGPVARRRARTMLGIAEDAFVIGTVGNLTAKKDQRTLLLALSALHGRVPRSRLVLVGTGPLEAQLQAQVRELGLEEVVLMTGSRDDVPDLLPAFDVFCLSSLHEGLPISLIEAMASGVPAVCTDVGGVSEALRHGIDGLLVPPADPGALAAALGRLVDEPDLRVRYAAAALDGSRRFDIGMALRRVEDLYDEVLARR